MRVVVREKRHFVLVELLDEEAFQSGLFFGLWVAQLGQTWSELGPIRGHLIVIDVVLVRENEAN